MTNTCMTSFNISDDLFQTVEVISRRSNGRTIHKVAHCRIGTLLALKSIPLPDPDGPLFCTTVQSRHESILLRDLHHANLVKCHGVAEDQYGCEINLLLEFMDGGSLAGKHIPHVGQLSTVAGQILEGIAYLHAKWVPHWDIKPSNILLTGGHVAKVGDFGGSRYLKTIRDQSELIDAVAYMSPERIEGELNVVLMDLYGFAADIWGFGMTLLEAYLGRYPIVFGGGNCSVLMAAICGVEPPEAPPDASAEFRDFISCCLRREPMRRWSAVELLRHPFILRGKPLKSC